MIEYYNYILLLMMDISKYYLTEKQIRLIEKTFLDIYFSSYDKQFLKSPAGRQDIEANVFRRYTNVLEHVVPWLGNQIELEGKNVVEIGCGPGSSTAALAPFVRKIDGYDIDEKSIIAAKERVKIMDIDNCNFWLVKPTELLTEIANNHESVDVFFMATVLEHQLINERIETLKLAWKLLKPGGLLVIVETPNRLTYWDSHTTNLPFFHLLPLDLAVQSEDVKRSGFIDSLRSGYNRSYSQGLEVFYRWGLGASYHEFEIALGEKYKEYICAEGFESEILSWFGVNLEEELLRYYLKEKKLNIPLAFSRSVLNVTFMKPKQDGSIKKMNTEVPESTLFKEKKQPFLFFKRKYSK